MKLYLSIFATIIFSFSLCKGQLDVVSDDLDNTGIRGLFFLNDSLGWGCGNKGKIIKTSDCGLTWEKTESDTNNDFYDIFFINENLGWTVGGILGSNGTKGSCIILKTIDGGLSWKEVFTGNDYKFNTIYFPSDSIGFVGGGLYSNKAGNLYKTTDYGETWNKAISMGDTYSGVHKINFVNDTSGFIVGSFKEQNFQNPFKGSVLKTNNGGKTWTSLNFMNNNYIMWGVYAINDSNALVVGSNYLYRIHGYGEIWDDEILPVNCALIGVKLFEDNQGIIISSNGHVIKLIDQGTKWEFVYDPEGKDFQLENPFIYNNENLWAIKNYRIVKFTNPNQIDEYNYLLQNDFNIYPNPVNEFLSFQNQQNYIEDFQIINSLGIQVKTGFIKERIDVSDLLSGIYFIKLKKQIKLIKFVKL